MIRFQLLMVLAAVLVTSSAFADGSPVGRAKNRRVEIVILQKASTPPNNSVPLTKRAVPLTSQTAKLSR